MAICQCSKKRCQCSENRCQPRSSPVKVLPRFWAKSLCVLCISVTDSNLNYLLLDNLFTTICILLRIGSQIPSDAGARLHWNRLAKNSWEIAMPNSGRDRPEGTDLAEYRINFFGTKNPPVGSTAARGEQIWDLCFASCYLPTLLLLV